MNFTLMQSKHFRAIFCIVAGFLILFVVFLPYSSRASEDFHYSVKINYDVLENNITNVSEIYSVTNQTTNRYLQSITLSTPTSQVDNLKVFYSDGTPIPFKTSIKTADNQGFKYNYQEIEIDFTRRNIGVSLNWEFRIQYRTNQLVEGKGLARIVYIPAIDPQNSDNYQISLSVPVSFGSIHGFSILPSSQQLVNDRIYYSFHNNDLADKSIQLLFGDYTIYETKFTFPLHNNSSFLKVFTVVLPPNTNSQSVFIRNLEPKPNKITLDDEGNVLAYYNVEAKTKVDVIADLSTRVKFLEYDLSKSGFKKDIPRNLVSKYTKPTNYWQSDNVAIKAQANKLTEGKKTVAEQVEAINDYVIRFLNYNNEKIKYNIRQGAEKAIADPNNAVCLEYSDLTIALLRAAGIPARMPVGYGFSGDLKTSRSVTDSLHSWVEVYVPGIGWMNLDPTWGEKFNNFGKSDLDHLAFAIWGEQDSEPTILSEAGRDLNYQYENATLVYSTDQPKTSNDSKLSATQWVVFPFLNLISFDVQGPNNAVTNNNIIESTNAKTPIANLAPSQNFWGIMLQFNGYFYQPTQVRFISDGRLLATSQASVSWLPIIIIGVTIVALITFIIIKLKNTKKLNKLTNIQEPKIHAESESDKKIK